LTHPPDAFDRAFVATSYLVGRRGEELLELLAAPAPAARALAERLSHPDRNVRAQILAAELAPIARALDAWRYR
jgi:hypothetical protein